MRKHNCRPGDLAITVDAYNPINIGSIVRVLHKHHNQSALSVEADDFLWYVEAAHYLTYSKDDKQFRRKRGAASKIDSRTLSVRTWPDSKHHLFTDSDAESHFQHIASWLSQHWIKDST